MDPAGTPLYESIKTRIIAGDITYEQGRAEILAHYTGAAIAEPTTVGEMLQEEFLTPLNMSHDVLAQATGVPRQAIGEILSNRRRLSAADANALAALLGTDADFWLNLQSAHDLWESRQK
ncbi:TPA: HigA family addiction module antidote protein [Pseudomonas aeruginosa]|nr:HigA family addiction module antidote protein [Pseudomonas aeruginosa]HCF4828258.1 HigA family addiction module antidote protein [Pseudomonas aeruginosa]HCF4834896.1 HigA family addiction module antidote protein [Pseudomonas aeruginosa]HCF4841294.1 HigA family addiction module antidote protein [Pseudomonas aeruginosa]